jgi:hypothetical protein
VDDRFHQIRIAGAGFGHSCLVEVPERRTPDQSAARGANGKSSRIQAFSAESPVV